MYRIPQEAPPDRTLVGGACLTCHVVAEVACLAPVHGPVSCHERTTHRRPTILETKGSDLKRPGTPRKPRVRGGALRTAHPHRHVADPAPVTLSSYQPSVLDKSGPRPLGAAGHVSQQASRACTGALGDRPLATLSQARRPRPLWCAPVTPHALAALHQLAIALALSPRPGSPALLRRRTRDRVTSIGTFHPSWPLRLVASWPLGS